MKVRDCPLSNRRTIQRQSSTTLEGKWINGDRPNALFFAGDLRQRIFQEAFSWKSVGVDVGPRPLALQINYRTSHQIRKQADRLLPSDVTDADGSLEDRTGTISLFNGPSPDIRTFDNSELEVEGVSQWLTELKVNGVKPHEIAVIVRSPAQLDRAEAAVQKADLAGKILDQTVEPTSGKVSISTMHLAKGLEFKAVVVMACDDEVIPLQARIESVADEADLQEVYDTERHLLYVACTRARDNLLVTSGGTASEFLDDLRSQAV
jgi:superfamily I DNA/RNA helicase